jgi:hypothetical protein
MGNSVQVFFILQGAPMGCFSYMCKVCGRAILSDSSRGHPVILFFIEDGKVKQKMEGEYDSYGRVFKKRGEGSHEWKRRWQDIVNIHFDSGEDGIAAIHTKCYLGTPPTTKSDDDPDQGWGTYEENDDWDDEPSYYLDVNDKRFF